MRLTTLSLLVLAAAIPLTALAQQVPAIENISFTPAISANTALKPLANFTAEPTENSSSENKPGLPKGAMLGQDRSIVFNYGENLPTVICAPLHVCEVRLQPGETIQQLDVGDPTRWSVKLARSRDANGLETSHLIIKPSDVGIASNLIAITDKRSYALQLVSRRDRSWMPKVAFAYPDEEMRANWQAYFNQTKPTNPPTFTPVSAIPATHTTSTLNFKYHLKGDKPVWKPVRVYADAQKTYIQLPTAAQNDEIPVLLVLGPDNTEQLVNYRIDGNQFIVDKVIRRAALISGVGKHLERVDIIREAP